MQREKLPEGMLRKTLQGDPCELQVGHTWGALEGPEGLPLGVSEEQPERLLLGLPGGLPVGLPVGLPIGSPERQPEGLQWRFPGLETSLELSGGGVEQPVGPTLLIPGGSPLRLSERLWMMFQKALAVAVPVLERPPWKLPAAHALMLHEGPLT